MTVPFAHLLLVSHLLAASGVQPRRDDEDLPDDPAPPRPSSPRQPALHEAFPAEWAQVRRARAQVRVEERFLRALSRRAHGPITEAEHLEQERRREEARTTVEEARRLRAEAELQRKLEAAGRALEHFVRVVLEHGEATKLRDERDRRREACAAREETRRRRAKARRQRKGRRGW